MEHREAVMESLAGANAPEVVLISEELFNDQKTSWLSRAAASRSDWFCLPSSLLDRVTSVRTSSGLCGLFRRPRLEWERILACPFLLIGWNLQDPGNLGTLIRSCAALTEGGLLLFGGCHPWSSKVARSSAGALLRTPIFCAPCGQATEKLNLLGKEGYRLFSLLPRGGQELSSADWSGSIGLIVGHESHGVPENIKNFTDSLTIPMEGAAESLNAGVAGSLACYEWSRGRRGKLKSVHRHG